MSPLCEKRERERCSKDGRLVQRRTNGRSGEADSGLVGVEENDSTKERGSEDLGNKGGHVRIACGQIY